MKSSVGCTRGIRSSEPVVERNEAIDNGMTPLAAAVIFDTESRISLQPLGPDHVLPKCHRDTVSS